MEWSFGRTERLPYGIPFFAGREAKFNPIDKSMTHIGPDFGNNEEKWERGAITDSGVIYCAPRFGRGILKIDTHTDDVTELNVNLLPERGSFKWVSCDVALDGCICFMPTNARRIMKLDPNNGDAMSSFAMTWEMDTTSTLERLLALTDVCMEYLIIQNASSNTIQSKTSHHL